MSKRTVRRRASASTQTTTTTTTSTSSSASQTTTDFPLTAPPPAHIASTTSTAVLEDLTTDPPLSADVLALNEILAGPLDLSTNFSSSEWSVDENAINFTSSSGNFTLGALIDAADTILGEEGKILLLLASKFLLSCTFLKYSIFSVFRDLCRRHPYYYSGSHCV